MPRRPEKDRPKTPPIEETLTIDSLGAQGDGIAQTSNGPVFLPNALPGETVRAVTHKGRGRVTAIETPSPDRHAPRCAHYTVCGGCSLQHLNDAPYLAFKREAVRAALASRGIDAEVDPVIPVPERTRRRATFGAGRRGTANATVGFHSARSHDLVRITDCAVLTPGLLALIPKLERLAQLTAPKSGANVITATETATGFDIAITGADDWFSADDRVRLSQEAAALGFARVTLDNETIIELKAPTIRAGNAWLTPPPGGFLQASNDAQSAMLKLVQDAIGEPRSLADLFAGSGTFSLPLASKSRVHAVESDAPALAALARAARSTPNLKPVTTETRDLFRRPLSEAELDKFDAIVLDPPRAGAEDQCRRLANAKVKRAVYASCSPASLARDLRLLLDGGWKIDRVTPVDQFLYSAHIEVVVALSR
jgi:23S rRNA (uracil1939-C5)-methyltransferase